MTELLWLMKLSLLLPGESALLKCNFLILTASWVVMYYVGPIPTTYASLYYLSLGADEFLLSMIDFCRFYADFFTRSCRLSCRIERALVVPFSLLYTYAVESFRAHR
jgi:hypothetical protein